MGLVIRLLLLRELFEFFLLVLGFGGWWLCQCEVE